MEVIFPFYGHAKRLKNFLPSLITSKIHGMSKYFKIESGISKDAKSLPQKKTINILDDNHGILRNTKVTRTISAPSSASAAPSV